MKFPPIVFAGLGLLACLGAYYVLNGGELVKQAQTQEDNDPWAPGAWKTIPRQLAVLAERGASDRYLSVARKIISRKPLSMEELKALGPEIDAYYHYKDGLKARPAFRNNLLSLVANYHDFAAAEALLQAGADLMGGGNLFIRTASNDYGNPYAGITEENFSNSTGFLEIYLKYGGDPNWQYPFSGATLISSFAANNNIWGVYRLLDAGANPWLRNIHGETFLMSLSPTDTMIRAQIRCAETGWFAKAPPGEADAIIKKYTEFYMYIIADDGFNKRNPYTKSGIRKFFSILLERGVVEPSEKMLEVLKDGQAGDGDTYGQ